MKRTLSALFVTSLLCLPVRGMASDGSDLSVAGAHALLASAPIASEAEPATTVASADAGDDSQAIGPTRSFSLARRLPSDAQTTQVSHVSTASTKRAPRPVSHRATVPAPDLQMTFATGSDVLTPGAQRRATAIATAMVEEGKSYLIQGHTDAKGAAASNLNLSQRRAAAVVKYLIDHGVPAEHLKAEGYGAEVPLPDHNPYDPANRRVEVMRQS